MPSTPQFVTRRPQSDPLKLMFRPRRIYQNASAVVEADGVCVGRKKALVLAPGEMCEIPLNHADVETAHSIVVRIEEPGEQRC